MSDSHGLLGYAVRRVLWAIPVLFVVSILVFWILRLARGNPVDVLLGHNYDEETAARLRDKYGYDEPIYTQYVIYMRNVFRGDLGTSTNYVDFSVNDVILPKIWISARLSAVAMIITLGLGIPIGIYAALARGTFLDPLTIGSWLLIDSIPVFVLIPVVQWLFSIKYSVFDLTWEGFTSPNIIPPILIMGVSGVAGTARFMRASFLSVMHEDFVRTARAKGLRERTVIFTHIARNAMLPLVTVIGLSLPGLAAGSLFVESLYGIPGVARAALQAIQGPDYDVVLSLVLIGSVLFVVANILVDLSYAVIDPRVRVGARRG